MNLHLLQLQLQFLRKRFLVLMLSLFSTVALFAQNSVTATYTDGHLPTVHIRENDVQPGSTSPCPGLLSIEVPLGKLVTTVDVQYSMTATNTYFYTKEQRSLLVCTTNGNTESTVTSGEGGTQGTYTYSRTGLTIAEGLSGSVDFELRAWRTYSHTYGTGCSSDYQRVNNNTWKITVYLEDDLRWYPDADGDGYVSDSPVESYTDPSTAEITYYQANSFPNAAMDCDDTNASVNPEAEEIIGDGIDNDCDPLTKDVGEAPANDDSDCGQVLAFDGSNDYISVPYDAALNTSTFSISVWAKMTGGQGTYRAVAANRSDAPTKGWIIYGTDRNTWAFVISNNSGSWESVDGPSIELDKWTHIGCTFDGTTAILYIDGAKIGETNLTYAPNPANELRIGAGNNETTANYFMNGLVDELRLWNSAISQSEVLEAAAGVSDNSDPNLVAYYDFNDQYQSTTLTDFTGNHGGTLNNMDPATDWVSANGNIPGQEYYADNDGDNYVGDPVISCASPGAGYYTLSELTGAGKELGDCDDTDANINPDAEEIVGDGYDNDCDPSTRDLILAPINSDSDCGQVLSFDGSDDYVSTGINITNRSFTLQGWVKLSDLSGDNFLFGAGTQSDNNGLHAGYIDNATRIRFSFYGYQTDADGSVSAPDTEWHHLAFSFDKENSNTMKIYLDGVEIASKQGNTSYQHSGTLNIGKNYAANHLEGLVDEVKIWNRALSSIEIAKSASGLLLDDESTALIAHYDFNDQKGSSTLSDLTGNHPGTLANMDAITAWAKVDGSASLITDQTITFEPLESVNFCDPDFELTAASSEGLPITYSSSNTDVAVVNGSTVTITGVGTTTITASQAGVGCINAASDVTQDLVVNAPAQNCYLQIDPLEDQVIDEEVAFSVNVSGTYTGPGIVSFSLDATSLANGMSIDATTGVFSWTPAENQNGAHQVTITNADEFISEQIVFNITVNEVNQPPVLAPIGDQQVDESETLSFSALATDADLPVQSLTYSLDASSEAKGMTIDASTGVFSWTPSEMQQGDHTVTITVSDGVVSGEETITIAVNEVNEAPVLEIIGNQSTNEEVTLSFIVSALDVDEPAQTLVYSLDAVSVDKGMVINASTRAFSWTPTAEQIGTHEVTISVTDGELMDSETFTITVNEAGSNIPPILSAIEDQTINSLSLLAFAAEANDVDGDMLIFSLDAASVAKGMTLDASSGAFSWTPTTEQVGNHMVTITVTDGELSDSETFSITVKETVTNVAPVLSGIEDQTVNTLTELTFTAEAIDQDGDALTFSLDASSEAKGMSINATSGAFSWTPTTEQVGIHEVIITVTDGELSDSETFSITVVETVTNVAPDLSGIEDKTVNTLSELAFTAEATDQDGDALTFSLDAASVAKGMTVDASSGAFSWTPTAEQVGIHEVIITVTDGELSDSETFSITVVETVTNVAPILSGIEDQTVNTLSELVFTAEATDEDGGVLSFSLDAASVAKGMTVDASSGAFSWTPTAEQVGIHEVIITVTDGELSDEETFSISVMTITHVHATSFEVGIYPNPMKDYLKIESSILWQLEILTIDGQFVIRTNSQSKIDVSSLPSGVYLLRMINNKDEIIKRKLIKE